MEGQRIRKVIEFQKNQGISLEVTENIGYLIADMKSI